MTAAGRHYKDRVGLWASGTSPTTPTSSARRSPRAASRRGIYRGLFLAARRGLRDVGQRRRHAADGRDRPARHRRVVAPLAFLRGALCLNRATSARAVRARIAADGYAHHAYTTRLGPLFRPPGRDDVTIGVLARLVRALDRAGTAGAIKRGLRHLPDGVRHPVQARPVLRRDARAAGRVLRHLRAHRLPQPARALVLAVPAARRRPQGAAASATAASSPACAAPTASAKPAYEAFRLPLVAEATGAPTSCGAACARRRRGPR